LNFGSYRYLTNARPCATSVPAIHGSHRLTAIQNETFNAEMGIGALDKSRVLFINKELFTRNKQPQ